MTENSVIEIDRLKDTIENMDKMHHIEILKILKKHKSVKINENKNGIYINISLLPTVVITELSNYLNYVNEQEKSISQMETQKEVFKNTFFSEKDNKEEITI